MWCKVQSICYSVIRDVARPKLLVWQKSIKLAGRWEGRHQQRTVHVVLSLFSFDVFLSFFFKEMLVGQIPVYQKGCDVPGDAVCYNVMQSVVCL